MKRTKKSSLLSAAAAIAGLTMGASLAMAAHPAIPLYTYEEVANQFFGPASTANPMGPPAMQMPVMIQNTTTMQGMPYSPKQTCNAGTCHGGEAGYAKLAKHAFHSALGWNEWMDNDPSGLFISPSDHVVNGATIKAGVQTGLNPQKPWLQSHGHNGKW